MFNQFQQGSNSNQQLAHADQLVQQLIQQTQQASTQYQQLLQQEQQNARTLEQLVHKEQQAVQIIQTALQGHQTAIQQLQQISALCNQATQTTQSHYVPVTALNNNQHQTNSYSNNSYQ
ncbi:AMP-dependent synthetase and ligase [Paenibacillus sp. GSMTC-2017]|uniref:AMP-dependent synthetase and ligase n=1 Tax=Paenibacillus sp. GSMTC-2017 TaxID=2794350 RepID=UPI0018D89A72|nr:AMP-dependent synthetase and ligase [Paenibacillus sp. GSMTC-2017]MBH5316861.1 AMP-dependent synthetase and ligase [Paenibacillus sp. GSMTC-2017]